MTQPVHEWMLDIVQAAEELGYRVRFVGGQKIGLARPEGRSFIDVELEGLFVNGAALRRILQPVEPKETT